MMSELQTFPRLFTSLWSARDVDGLAQMFVEDADLLTLTNQWCEGRMAISAALSAEFAGAFARARLVTGKTRMRPLGPEAAVLHQRVVLSGLVDASGQDMGRVGAVIVAALGQQNDEWLAVSMQFTALSTA